MRDVLVNFLTRYLPDPIYNLTLFNALFTLVLIYAIWKYKKSVDLVEQHLKRVKSVHPKDVSENGAKHDQHRLPPPMQDILSRLDHHNECINILSRATLMLQELYCQRHDALDLHVLGAERVAASEQRRSTAAWLLLLPVHALLGGGESSSQQTSRRRERLEGLTDVLNMYRSKSDELHYFWDGVRIDTKASMRQCQEWIREARVEIDQGSRWWGMFWSLKGRIPSMESDIAKRRKSSRNDNDSRTSMRVISRADLKAFVEQCKDRLNLQQSRVQSIMDTHWRVLDRMGHGEDAYKRRLDALGYPFEEKKENQNKEEETGAKKGMQGAGQVGGWVRCGLGRVVPEPVRAMVRGMISTTVSVCCSLLPSSCPRLLLPPSSPLLDWGWWCPRPRNVPCATPEGGGDVSSPSL